jgi:Ca2+-binding RTX toxin-like protein
MVALGGGGDGAGDGLGNDEYRAGTGNDTLIVFDGGRDAFFGGPGRDAAAWFGNTSGVVIDLAAGLISGGNERGSLRSFEDAHGDAGPDRLIGNADNNRLRGDNGNDYIEGRGGDDILKGNPADDFLDGGRGFDRLDGDGGMDTCIAAEVVVDCEA